MTNSRSRTDPPAVTATDKPSSETEIHPPLVPVFGELESDPGCSDCGACIHHDGCADASHPLQDGDCETCGACRACIELCEQMRAQ